MRGREGQAPARSQHAGQLGHERGGVGDEGGRAVRREDEVEAAVVEGESGRVGLGEQWRRAGGAGAERRGGGEHAGGQVGRDDPGAVRGAPAGALRPAAAELQDRQVGERLDRAEDVQVLLGPALGAPHEVGVAEEATVLGEVVVRLTVPPPTVGGDRLLLCVGQRSLDFIAPGEESAREGPVPATFTRVA